MAQSYLSNYHQIENGHYQNDNRAGWRYQTCECCPYGYHIDLDFVRYCEAIKDRADYTGSVNKRRERRRQRQSMEVMLGLLPPPQVSTVPTLTQTAEVSSPLVHKEFIPTDYHSPSSIHLQSALVQDALGDVVTDFERTLERSTGSSTIFDSPDASRDAMHRASSNSSVSSGNSGPSWNNPSITTSAHQTSTFSINGINEADAKANASTLKHIRKQMALGLERMRELEEQVKMIPSLQVQISVLKDEKRNLLHQIREQSSIQTKSIELQKNIVASRKDVGIMCGTITRTIGVGPQYPRTRTTSTETPPLEPQIIVRTPSPIDSPVMVTRDCQTAQVRLVDSYVQTKELVKRLVNSGINAKPEVCDFALQISNPTRTIGVSNDSIQDTFCNKCNVLTRSIGVGPAGASDSFIPVSLKNLSVPRSKSFNLGEEKLEHKSKHRTIGCQSESFSIHRACQYEAKVSSRASQYEPTRKSVSKGIQYESLGVNSQHTDTNGLTTPGKDVYTNTATKFYADATCNTLKPRLSDATSNTKKVVCTDASSNTVELMQSSEDGKRKDEQLREESVSIVSRIPRPQHSPAAERHKLKRQDTYTKIPAAVPPPLIGLSGIDLTPVVAITTPATNIVESECSNSLTKNKSNYNITDISSSPSTTTTTTSETHNVCSSSNKQVHTSVPSQPPVPEESALFNAGDRSSHSKAIPTKEMQAAMKVLNDSLQKSKHNASGMTNSAKSHLKNALHIIQQEWFKVSSLVNANPLDVEDYLDRFEEISSSLLQYIVNMTDDSGNTAMHYAVSHGNFDVVSILLDSKVCNINKPNLAGYTSVMLVSLTEVRSPTDATVVRRLFLLADVNVRATQHGQTALMLAVSHGRLDMVQMLLEAGADINIQDEDGSTALMCAAEHGHMDIVKYFLNHPECDSTIVDVDGSTALKIALEAGHKDIGVLLYAHGNSVHGISGLAAQRKIKSASVASSSSVSRSPSRGAFDNKHSK